MSTPSPFLDTHFLPRWSQLTPDRIVPDITAALADAEARLDALCRTDRGRMTFATTFLAFESALIPLNEAWGLVSHLDSVCNSPALRDAHHQMLPKVTEFFARLYLNEALWDLLKTYSTMPAAAELNGVDLRFLEETMADFRQNGADLPTDKKQRMETLEAELAQVTQQYSENVLDATNAWELLLHDPAQLTGLPESAIAAAAADARAKDHTTIPTWRFTLKGPSLMPVLEFLHDDTLRRHVWEASTNIGRTPPHDNTPLIARIIALRQEKAHLLGRKNFADLVIERRMAKTGAAATHFIEKLHARVQPAFSRQVRELQEYKGETLQQASGLLQPWEVAWWSEHRRRQLFDFDQEEVRAYFAIDSVIDGMFRLCENLFAISISQHPTIYRDPGATISPADDDHAIEVWHPEVKFYEIRNERGVHLGSFYADWHPRDAKRGGAWMNYLRTGCPPRGEQDREPHLGLICGNMSPPVDGRPTLLTHSEVETIFHEFGHLLHHLLGQVSIRSLNGVNVAWDFVELPSQIMENFCWERESLDLFARHHQTGEPIPPKLLKKMLASRNYMAAVSTMRQLAFARMDLGLHMERAPDIASGSPLDQTLDDLLKGYLMPLQTRPPTMARRFSHIFGSSVGYAGGYYSYKWAEVLDADCFSKFKKTGVLNPDTGRSFRDCILAKGNAEPPEKLFRDFMGREPDLEALMQRSGLA